MFVFSLFFFLAPQLAPAQGTGFGGRSTMFFSEPFTKTDCERGSVCTDTNTYSGELTGPELEQCKSFRLEQLQRARNWAMKRENCGLGSPNTSFLTNFLASRCSSEETRIDPPPGLNMVVDFLDEGVPPPGEKHSRSVRVTVKVYCSSPSS